MIRRILMPALSEVGPGAVARLPEILRHLGVFRALVIIDEGLPVVVEEQLAAIIGDGLACAIVRGPSGEPTTEATDEFTLMARSLSCDGIVAVGGGSIMDLGKAVSMLTSHPGGAAQYQGLDLVAGQGLPVICVPTTAGSGAEATRSAVLTNPRSQVKRGLNAAGVLPSAVILDANLLLTLPKGPRIAALLDAVAHATESYIGESTWVVSEMTALAAFSNLGDHLRFEGDTLTIEQAEKALLGSFFAGSAICNSETGAVHALAYPLTEYHAVPHACAVGLLLPDVMLLQEDACTDRLDQAAAGMGFDSRHDFISRVAELRDELDAKAEVRQIISEPQSLSRLVERAMTLTGALNNSPRRWTQSDARNAYLRLAI